MSWGTADELDRTAKILIDSGKASSPTEAHDYLDGLVLQVAVGPEIERDHAAQAALATVVNVGRRAYRGGVHVHLQTDPALTVGWSAELTTPEMVTRYGGTMVDRLTRKHPTLVIGRPNHRVGTPTLYCAWRGWSGGVTQAIGSSLASDTAIGPAGVLAAAIGVSETFQQQLGNVVAGRRDVGISLWRPDLDWRSAEAGPALQYLPAALWLLGLGHLGQAYAWTLGMLPYATPNQAELGLVDFDTVVKGNTATQLLVGPDDIGKPKTRVVATALENLGFRTRIVERAFDQDFHPVIDADPTRNEPITALAGFDSPKPRRALGEAGFQRVVDAGLGTGPVEYLDMVLHAFPDADPATAFPDDPRSPRLLADAYEGEISRQVHAGAEDATARCGILDIAGVTVGAAFVGTVASTLVVADILRLLHDGESYSVIALDLRDPRGIRAVVNSNRQDRALPRYTRAR
jgi:hypothetical protein